MLAPELGSVFVRDPEGEQPDWRYDDPDDAIDDNDDPSPVAPDILTAMLGASVEEILESDES